MLPLFLTDGYKLDHRRQYPKGTEFIQSNWTPRSCKYLPFATDGAVVFGIRYFVEKYLQETFNKDFFGRNVDEVCNEYQEFLDSYLGPNEIGTDHIRELHNLGYLPIAIYALEEGTLCPINSPSLVIMNTDKRFYWLVNYLETLMSCTLWLGFNSATIAREYKKELYRHATLTGFDKESYVDFLCHDFSMRGMQGIESSVISGMAHMTSFIGSETLPAVVEFKKCYGKSGEFVASTVAATEHSVMCAGGKVDELQTFRRLITELYPNGFVSIVSDTWDYWKVITEYTKELKEEILARDGRVVFRPDSGTPEDIICGLDVSDIRDFDKGISGEYTEEDVQSISKYDFEGSVGEYIKMANKYWKITKIYNDCYISEVKEAEPHILKGTYELLWEEFGGTVNEKGYKVLNPKVGVIYGDSITLERQKVIYKRLEEKGFCASNLVLGVGSFTYCYNTRDSLGQAMKATWCQIDGKSYDIFKDPKTDDGTKKSSKGFLTMVHTKNGVEKVECQGFTFEEGLKFYLAKDCAYKLYYRDGVTYYRPSITEVRENVNRTLG